MARNRLLSPCLVVIVWLTLLAAASAHEEAHVEHSEHVSSSGLAESDAMEHARSEHGELHSEHGEYSHHEFHSNVKFETHRGEHSHGDHEASHGMDATCKAEVKEHVDLAVAVMLLGTMCFMMSLFYLVNHPDHDIRFHSWQVLSATISIFTAVMVFQGITSVLKGIVECGVDALEWDRTWDHCIMIVIRYCMVVCWFTLMHMFIRWSASWADGSDDNARKVSNAEYLENKERFMTCWATLIAHMTAFAAISGGDHLMRLQHLHEPAVLGFIPVLLTIALLFILFRASDCVRSYIPEAHEGSLGEIWDSVAEEAENDLAGICISFLFVSAIVLNLTGELPHSHETEHSEHHELVAPPVQNTCILLGLGLGFVGLTVVMTYVNAQVFEADNDAHESKVGLDRFSEYLARWYFIIQTVFAMCFSWCLLQVAMWEVTRIAAHSNSFIDPHSAVAGTILALGTSGLSFGLIFGLDTIHDLEFTGKVADRCLKSVMGSLAILVGFSWEHCFDLGIEAVVHSTTHGFWMPKFVKFGIGIAVASVIVPAWRLYILKNVMDGEKKKNEDGVGSADEKVQSFALLAGVDPLLTPPPPPTTKPPPPPPRSTPPSGELVLCAAGR